jgi:hypothetical protein
LSLTTSSPQRVQLGFEPDGIGIVGSALGTLAVGPSHDRCSHSSAVCAIAQLDIDALRIAILGFEMIAILGTIDALGQDDELTVAEVFAMERLAHRKLAELLSPTDIDRLLSCLG